MAIENSDMFQILYRMELRIPLYIRVGSLSAKALQSNIVCPQIEGALIKKFKISSNSLFKLTFTPDSTKMKLPVFLHKNMMIAQGCPI